MGVCVVPLPKCLMFDMRSRLWHSDQVCFALKPLTHSLTSGCITLPAVQEDSDEDSDCEYDHDGVSGGDEDDRGGGNCDDGINSKHVVFQICDWVCDWQWRWWFWLEEEIFKSHSLFTIFTWPTTAWIINCLSHPPSSPVFSVTSLIVLSLFDCQQFLFHKMIITDMSDSNFNWRKRDFTLSSVNHYIFGIHHRTTFMHADYKQIFIS